jgi:hypothetical protein
MKNSTTATGYNATYTPTDRIVGTRRSRRAGILASTLCLALLAGFVQAQETARVSVKVVTDQFGNRPTGGYYATDQQIYATINNANEALANMSANWRLEVAEIVEAPVSEWFYLPCEAVGQMEQAAKSNPVRFAWSESAINIYVVADLEGCAGVCSFPHGMGYANTSSDMIIINNVLPVNGALDWLHEIGHYFGLFHTFQNVDDYLNMGPYELNVCLGPGGIRSDLSIQRCPDTCPHEQNVMSYTDGQSLYETYFSSCQLDIVTHHQSTTRANVMTGQTGVGVTPLDDDNYEENDAPGNAYPLAAGTWQLKGMDDDWFMITMPSAGNASFRLEGPEGDLDMYLFNSSDTNNPILYSEEYNSQEQFEGDLEAGTYYVLVHPYLLATSDYVLEISLESAQLGGTDDAYEPNNTMAMATPVTNGSYELIGLDSDVFRIDPATAGTLTASIAGMQGDLDIMLLEENHSPDQDPLAYSWDEYTSNETMTYDFTAGSYFIVVSPWEGNGGPYTLTINMTEGTGNAGNLTDDEYEDNDTPEQARALVSGTMSLVGLDEDWFRVDLPNGGLIDVQIAGSEGDIDILLYDEYVDYENPTEYSINEGSNDGFQTLVGPGTWYVATAPYEGQFAAYTMTVSVEAETGNGNDGSSDGSTGNANEGSTDGNTGNSNSGQNTNNTQSEEPSSTEIIVSLPCGAGAPGAMGLTAMGLMGMGARRKIRTR